MTKHETWLVIPDLQYPYTDTRSLAAVLEFASERRWDGCIQLGDFMDWEWISRWVTGNQLIKEGKRIKSEYQEANRLLDTITAAVRRKNPSAHIVILEGNHDYRIQKLIQENPMLEGLIEMEEMLNFKKRGIYYHPYWTTREPYKIGKARFIHGEYTNKYHAAKTVDNFGHSIFYGHTHDHQLYSKVFRGEGETVVGESFGTLSKYDMPYMGKKPSAWQQGFGIFEFFPDGYFNHTFVDIFKHRFRVPGDSTTYQG